MYEPFFRFARERYRIYDRKRRGLPRPWTEDPILDSKYFTNVYREHDKTTVWFRENVRDKLRTSPSVLLATVLFRWFNRIDIGETIFKQIVMDYVGDNNRPTGWGSYLTDGSVKELEHSIRTAHPGGPWVNGAYIIKGTEGMDKLAGVCDCLAEFYEKSGWMDVATTLWDGMFMIGIKTSYNGYDVSTMRGFTEWLAQTRQLGMFMAYEVACDLRHTGLLENAPDVMTWANPGPGCKRGLSRLTTGGPETPPTKNVMQDHMRAILRESENHFCGALEYEGLARPPSWEMREVEHTLCEFDKYERVREGGRAKRNYR